jgi:hypothetical protein
MRTNTLTVMRSLFVYILLGATVCSGGEHPGVAAVQTYPARQLPAKFIATFVATSGISTPKQERLNLVRSIAEQSKAQRINAVNLILEWNDLEPQQGAIDYDLLDSMITEIKSRDLFCILRIYVNVENRRAWPLWVIPIQTYIGQGKTITNILPWDSKYQTVFELFQQNLANHFVSTQIQPDAFQITVGGSYAEQILDGYDRQAAGLDRTSFYEKLFSAEIEHVDIYFRTLGHISKDHILMVNSLFSSDIAREDEVGTHARNKGAIWIESNAGACSLYGQSYGRDNMRMLGRFKGSGARIFLEDESGNWSCPLVSQDASLSHRVDLMRQLQSMYGFSFDAVSINKLDLNDTSGILVLKNLLGL